MEVRASRALHPPLPPHRNDVDDDGLGRSRTGAVELSAPPSSPQPQPPTLTVALPFSVEETATRFGFIDDDDDDDE